MGEDRIAALRCEPLGADRVRACAYDGPTRRAYALALRFRDGSWHPEGEPVALHDGGVRARGPEIADAVARAVSEWHASDGHSLGEASARMASAERDRARRRVGRLSATRRASERAAARAARSAEAWSRVASRTLRAHPPDAPLSFEVPGGGGKVSVLVSDCDMPVRLSLPGNPGVGRDGRIDASGAEPALVRSIVLEAARRRPEPLMPVARMVAARWEERVCRARSDSLAREIERASLAAEAPAPVPAAPTSSPGPAGPAPDRVPWSRCACLPAGAVRVTLHDLARWAQVVAVADPDGAGGWSVRSVKAVYPFGTRKRVGEASADLDDAIRTLASDYAAAHPEDLAVAASARQAAAKAPPHGHAPPDGEGLPGVGVPDLPDAPRAAPRAAAERDLAARAAAARALADAAAASLAERGREPVALPYEGTVRSGPRTWRVSASPGAEGVSLGPEAPVSTGPGEEPERVAFVFAPDGTPLGPDAACRRVMDVGHAWAMWAERLSREAAEAMAAAVVGRIGAEVEAALLLERACALEAAAGVAAITGRSGGEPEPGG